MTRDTEMINITKGLAGACALLTMSSTAAASATECWNPTQAAAARVRNLQSRLMDATLRCQMVGVDITAAYNGFIRENRNALQGANAVLRARMGEPEFDRFVTAQANHADHAPLDANSCNDAAADAAAAIAAAGNIEALLLVEADEAVVTDMPGGLCGISFAAADVTAASIVAGPSLPLP